MAVELDKLIVRIDANVAKFDQQLKKMSRSSVRTAERYEKRFQEANQKVQRSFSQMRTAATAILGGLGVRQVQQYADTWTEAGNKIAAAEEISGRQARTLSMLNDISIETRSELSTTVDLYARLLRATKDVAESEEDVALATELTNKAFKAGGAATSEQIAGILQLSQALGSGFLQGDELRSIRENAPLIAAAIAKEFETTIGGLKDLGAEGKLTSDRVFQAILNSQSEIESAFETTNSTIGDGFTRLKNSLIEYIGIADDNIQATEKIVAALTFLADNLNLVAAGAVLLGARGLTPLAVSMAVKLAPAATTAATALQLMALKGGVAYVAMTALRGAMALLGGPLGIGALAVSGGLYVFSKMKDDSISLQEEMAKLNVDFEDFARKNEEIAKDYKLLEQASRDLAVAQAEGSQTAIDAAEVEIDAIEERISKHKELRAELLILQQQKANLAQQNVDEVTQDFNSEDLTRQIEIERRIHEERLRLAREGEALRVKDVQAIEAQVAAMELSETAIQDIQAAYRELLAENAKYGIALTEEQRSWLALSEKVRVAEDELQNAEDVIVSLSGSAPPAAAGLDLIAASASNVGNQSQIAAAGIQSLLSLMPQFNSAVSKQTQLSEAYNAYQNALSGSREDAESAKFLYEQVVQEIGGSAEAARDATAALDDYLDDSHLSSLSARERAIALETTRYQELSDQLKETGASEAELAALREANAQNLQNINTSFDDNDSSGGGGGGGSSDTSADGLSNSSGIEEIDQLKLELELIGKTRAEAAALRYEYQALKEAKEAGADLDVILTESGQSLRQTIEEEANAIGRLTEEVEQYREQAEFLEDVTNQLQDGFIDSILSGEKLSDTFAGLAKQIAKAALQALLFGKGPLAGILGGGGGGILGGGGGGGLFGDLFGFESGGYTGSGHRKKPAGIVHKGEYVFDADATRKIGVRNLERLRNGMSLGNNLEAATKKLRGYEVGGLVGAVPNFESSAPVFNPNINVSSAPAEVVILDATDEKFERFLNSPRGRRAQEKSQARSR